MRGAIDRIAPVTHSEIRNDGTMQARTNSSISHGRVRSRRAPVLRKRAASIQSVTRGRACGRSNAIPAVKKSSVDARRRARRMAEPSLGTSPALRALANSRAVTRFKFSGPSFDWASIFTPISPPKKGSNRAGKTGLCAQNTPLSHHFSAADPAGVPDF